MRKALARFLDTMKSQDADQKELLPLSKALCDLELQSGESVSNASNATRFYTAWTRPRDS